MRSYPIWVDVKACIYKSSKSYGAKDTNQQSIYVGTSASNSHLLAKISTTRREDEHGNTVFRFSVDGNVLKTITLDAKTKQPIK